MLDMKGARRWFGQAQKHAQEAIKYGHPAQAHLDPNILRQAVDDWDILETSLDKGSRALATIRDEVKRVRALAFPTPPPMFEDTAAKATSNEAAPGDAASETSDEGT